MILLNPGPVNVSERVRQALSRQDICHRESEFSRLLQEIRKKLIALFAAGRDYTSVVLTGSGTAAVEAAICCCLDKDGKLLVINNGVYGERMVRMASAHGMDTVDLRFSWHERPNLSQLESVLSQKPTIQVIAMVHHETTTGIINPVREVGALAKQYKKKLLVDSVSGLGGESLDLTTDGVDICVSTSGKCIQGFPGVCFVIIRQEEMERLQKIQPRSLYLYLPEYFQDQERGSIPFTPAVQLYYAFDEALVELSEEGLSRRIARYQASAQVLREGFQKLGLRFLLQESFRSNSITSLYLPKGMPYERLHDSLKDRGYVIYAGQNVLKSDIFRVANMGALTRSDFEGFLAQLEQVLL